MSLLYKDTPAGFHRVLDGPLDDHEIFTSNAALLDYCKNGTAYHGQRVLLTYEGLYDQPCIIKKGRQSDYLVPVLDLQSGIELVTMTEGTDIYGLVCYFNDGNIYTDDKDIMLKLDDIYYFAMLPQAGLLANSDTEITYKFQIKNKPDELLVSGNVFTGNGVAIMNKIKENLIAKNILKVWVRCNNYFNATGV